MFGVGNWDPGIRPRFAELAIDVCGPGIWTRIGGEPKFPDPRDAFPVIALRFPVKFEEFPVRPFREITRNLLKMR